ncbi:MAG: HyaD/HybD family hydrogenase maturation endopeptidase [Bacillota bacterium]|nr:HyaD/HybD family hydrogenase maturation endopeptidase [Bacillota bacterium]
MDILAEERRRYDILVLGVGNILLKDEGVGVRVVEALRSRDLPPGVELMDGGTLGLDLMSPISRADRLIVVDAVQAGDEPGAVYRFRADEVDVKRMPITSLHQVSLFEVLSLCKQMGQAPREVVVIGVEPKEINWGMELTPEIQQRVEPVVELVLQEIQRLRGESAAE